MCRLFGMISVAPRSAAPWLLDAPVPFTGQANIDPSQLQKDGWGIAWFDAKEKWPRVEKGSQPIFDPEEAKKFTKRARGLTAPLIIAHLRKASNPLGLTPAQLIARENSQPFLSDETIFAHNGWIGYPKEVRRRLGERASRVHGVNDSEVLEQLLLHLLDSGQEPWEAYGNAMGFLIDVWKELGQPTRAPFGGMNILFSPSPQHLWAFCRYSGDHGSCLSGLPRPYYEMSYQKASDHLIVTSEPFDRDLARWTPLKSGEFLHAHVKAGELVVEHERLVNLPPAPGQPRADWDEEGDEPEKVLPAAPAPPPRGRKRRLFAK